MLREWAGANTPFGEIVVFVPEDLQPESCLRVMRFPFTSCPGTGGLAFHWGLGRAARRVDLLFCPSYAAPLAYRGPFVVTVHDALSALMPPHPGLRQRLRHRSTRSSARRARHVITVSETSSRDIATAYGVPASRITAVPNGCGADFFVPPTAGAADDVRRRYSLDGSPFCLFVGKFARRRNLPTLVEAFAEARGRAGMSHALVLAGQSDAAEPLDDVPDFVRVTGYVPEQDLHVLYHEAELFVYPSSYEGSACPCSRPWPQAPPVLTARNSALVEVAGDATLLVDEPRRDLLADALTRLLTDAALRDQLAERGRQRARLFPWSRTATETMEVLAAVSSAAA